jgi:hypothetical protein
MSDSRRNHALCDTCYGGMVDVGEARADPRRVDAEYRIQVTCCSCRELTRSGLFLEADLHRFNDCWQGDPDGFRSFASFSRAEFNATSPARYTNWGDWLLRSPVAA